MPEELANEISQGDIKEQKEREKLQLEIDKLNNENRELNKSWWKKPQYIAAFSPLILGVVTLITAFASGFLQNQAKLNEIQKLTFEQDKQKYQTTINELNERILIASVKEKMLTKSVDSLKSAATIAKQKLDSFLFDKRGVSEKVISLIQENGLLRNRINDLNQTIVEISKMERKYKQIIDSIPKSKEDVTIPAINLARIYPNPVTDFATLEISSYLLSKAIVIIVDKDGKKVFVKEIELNFFRTTETLDLRGLQKGGYFAFVQFSNGELGTIKIVKS